MDFRCPSCGSATKEDERICSACGWDFVARKRMPRPGGAPAVPPAAAPGPTGEGDAFVLDLDAETPPSAAPAGMKIFPPRIVPAAPAPAAPPGIPPAAPPAPVVPAAAPVPPAPAPAAAPRPSPVVPPPAPVPVAPAPVAPAPIPSPVAPPPAPVAAPAPAPAAPPPAPAAAPAPAAPEPVAAAPAPAGPPRKRILVVEDEPGYQELMESILITGPLDLTICGSVEEAVVKIDTELFDMIITDINLLGLTGFEVLGKMKALDRLESCPVVMCSSQFDEETKEMALNMGAAGFIPKPYQYEMVLSTVKAILGIDF